MRRYELWLTDADADADAIGLAFPALALGARGDSLIAFGRLDDGGLQAVLVRLGALGAQVLGVRDTGP